jgi:hypothetical protein
MVRSGLKLLNGERRDACDSAVSAVISGRFSTILLLIQLETCASVRGLMARAELAAGSLERGGARRQQAVLRRRLYAADALQHFSNIRAKSFRGS